MNVPEEASGIYISTDTVLKTAVTTTSMFITVATVIMLWWKRSSGIPCGSTTQEAVTGREPESEVNVNEKTIQRLVQE